jgi:hypothetical protein
MSFMTRVRLAVVQWWIRNAEARRRSSANPGFVDLEGFGRSLARPPLRDANHPRPACLPPSLPVAPRLPAPAAGSQIHNSPTRA